MNSFVLFIMGIGFTLGLVLSSVNKEKLEASQQMEAPGIHETEAAELPADPLDSDEIANPFKTFK